MMFVHPVIRQKMVDITSSKTTTSTLNIHLIEQMMLLITSVAILPLVVIECIGTIKLCRLISIFIYNEYIVACLHKTFKTIHLYCVYVKHEYEKQKQIRKRRRQKYMNPNKKQESISSRGSNFSTDETSKMVADLGGSKKENISINLAQQQMNEYVNKHDHSKSDRFDVNGNNKRSKDLNGFTFTEEEIKNWVPSRKVKKYSVTLNDTDDNDKEEDSSSSDEDNGKFDEFGLSKALSYDEREKAANDIEKELTNVYKQLKELGFNPAGSKKEDVVENHLNVSKKLMSKKWIRSELREKFGNEVLVSCGANFKTLKKDREEALWSIEKKRREKERRRREWEKYNEHIQNKKNIDVGSLGLQSNTAMNRGRD
jgi:hypothetical protein